MVCGLKQKYIFLIDFILEGTALNLTPMAVYFKMFLNWCYELLQIIFAANSHFQWQYK